MPVSMRQKLVAHLMDGLHAVERELQRRGLTSQKAPSNARSDAPPHYCLASHYGMPPSVEVQAKGRYEVVETTRKQRLIVLDGRAYAWKEGPHGALLVPVQDRFRRAHVLQRGRFVLADVDDEPGLRLFLERDGRYEEHVLPEGLPTSHTGAHRIAATGRAVASSELERDQHALAPTDLEERAHPVRVRGNAVLAPVESGEATEEARE